MLYKLLFVNVWEIFYVVVILCTHRLGNISNYLRVTLRVSSGSIAKQHLDISVGSVAKS